MIKWKRKKHRETISEQPWQRTEPEQHCDGEKWGML